MGEKKVNEPVKLTSAATRVEAEMIESMLEECQIPCFIKDLESGGYMNIYMGYSVFGSEIYVRGSDLEAAKALLSGQEQQTGWEMETGDDGNSGCGSFGADEISGEPDEGEDAGAEEDEGWDAGSDEISGEDIYRSKRRAVQIIVGLIIMAAAVSTILCAALRFVVVN